MGDFQEPDSLRGAHKTISQEWDVLASLEEADFQAQPVQISTDLYRIPSICTASRHLRNRMSNGTRLFSAVRCCSSWPSPASCSHLSTTKTTSQQRKKLQRNSKTTETVRNQPKNQQKPTSVVKTQGMSLPSLPISPPCLPTQSDILISSHLEASFQALGNCLVSISKVWNLVD